MSAVDIAGSALRIASELAPYIAKLVASGVDEHTITATLIAAAQSTAVERVASRAGRVTPPLVVMAVHLEDATEQLRALGRVADAQTVAAIAADLRADAPTSPLTIGRAR